MDGGSTKVLFLSAEEAWFWFTRCQLARWEGARIESTTKSERPCGPDDIYRWACELYRARAIGPAHMEVMAEYGFLERAPDDHLDSEIIAAALWTEGMRRLEGLLIEKGVVQP